MGNGDDDYCGDGDVKAAAVARTEQANSVRLIYSLTKCRPKQPRLFCKLTNGLYLSKIPRTDERLRFTEADIRSIVRTILFMYVFDVSPRKSMLDLVNTGTLDTITDRDMADRPRELTTRTAKRVLDELIGANFSVIARKPVRAVIGEYMKCWRYYNLGVKVSTPNAKDFIKIYRFINTVLADYSQPTLFINSNLNDHKIHLQGTRKILK